MDEGLFRRRRLPHLDVEDGTYFVTSCLEGSLSANGLLRLYKYRDELHKRPTPAGTNESDWEAQKQKLIFARLDTMLDVEAGVRWLEQPDLADCVERSLRHFAGQRYDLIAFVVMPSHFHWVFKPRLSWWETARATSRFRSPRESIMHSAKSFTAIECNRLLGRTGRFWQDESYDHVVRDDQELERIVEYIASNPVRAGLVVDPKDLAVVVDISSRVDSLWGRHLACHNQTTKTGRLEAYPTPRLQWILWGRHLACHNKGRSYWQAGSLPHKLSWKPTRRRIA